MTWEMCRDAYQPLNTFPRKSVFLSFSNIVIHHQNYLEFTNITKLPKFTLFLEKNNLYIHYLTRAASWRKRLGARLPPLGSRVRVSVPSCGFRGGRNGVWVGFSRGFSRFPLLQISFHHFSTLLSSISFHFISPCDGASGVVCRGFIASHPSTRPCVGHELRLFIFVQNRKKFLLVAKGA